MKKLLLLVLLLANSSFVFTQNEDDILWHPKTQLTWDDFQGKPQANHFAAALTNASIQFAMKFEDNVYKIDTRVFFKKKTSWVKEKGKNDYILKHEQIHFDIFEVYARRFRKALLELDATLPPKKFSKKMVKTFKKHQKMLLKAQKQYDRETEHSIKKEPQAAWNRKVEEELKNTWKYSHPFLEIKYGV